METSDIEQAFKNRRGILEEPGGIGFSVVALDLEGFAGGKMNRFLDQAALK